MQRAASVARFRLLASVVPYAFLGACSESSSPPAAASVTAAAATNLTATAGSAVATSPSVKVTDSKGSAIAGTVVRFDVVTGGGAVARASATTDASGIANAGTWTLGTTAGTNTLEATVAGLPVVRFTATGSAGPAASIATMAGDNQSGAVGAALPNALAVMVKDQYSNAVAGAAVTFSVMSGGGTLTGATTTTGADGIARLGAWTLGIANGAQQLRATAGTLSTTLSATATVPAGCTVINYALGATLASAWEADDCANASFSGRRYDRLQFTTTSQQQIDAQVSGAAGRALLLRNAATGLYVGRQPGTAFSPPSQNPMHLKYILAPGSYVFEPHAPDATATGSYTFATTTGTNVDCAYIVFASTNVQFSDEVTANSCVGPSGGKEQWINLQLKTGTKVRITLSGSEFVPILVLRDDRLGPASPTLVAKVGTAVGETLVIDWTATFDTWHEVIVAPKTAALGRYTLKIEELP
jgi:hypothetical protein